MSKTGTYKKVFQTVENDSSTLFSNLPETTLTEKIYKHRIIKGVTQREFAKICDIGYSSLCKYETGSSKPDVLNMEKIGKIIDGF